MKFLKRLLLVTLLGISSFVGAQSVLMGEVSPGAYKPLSVNAYGNLTPSEFYGGIGFGDQSKIRRVIGLGQNPSVDTATTPEDVWYGGGLYPWMTGATSLEVVSTSANDTAVGTGARALLLVCLNTSFIEITQLPIPNGLTAVPVPTQCYRINTFIITAAGSGGVNAGDIIIRDAGGGTVRGIIPAGLGTAQQSNYTVPAGWTLQIVSQLFALVKNQGGGVRYADIATFMQFPASPSGSFYRIPVTYSVSDSGPYRHDGLPGIILTEKTDFILRVRSVSANGTGVSASWLGVMRNNTP